MQPQKKQDKTHKWAHWRYLVLNGKVRKGIASPRRERLLVREALSRLGYKYRELVPFINHHYHGYKGEMTEAVQWLDFLVWDGKKMFALMFKPGWRGGGKARDKVAMEAKKKFLTEKNIGYLVMSRNDTSQIYERLIRTLSERRSHEQRASQPTVKTTND